MNLWLCGLVLVAGLFLHSSALSVEECRPLITPLPTFEPNYGRWIFIMGWITSDPHRVLFKTTRSQWIDFVQTDQSDPPRQMRQDIGISHPTHCKYGEHVVTFHQNIAVTDKSNFTCTYHSLPTCEDCLLIHVESRTNNQLIHIMDIDKPKTIAEVKEYRAFYLMAKENQIKPIYLIHAMKQARCLGFEGEPDFVYNPEYGLCDKHKVD